MALTVAAAPSAGSAGRSRSVVRNQLPDNFLPGKRYLLHQVLREEFVRIYSEPLLMNFRREQLQARGIALPAMPVPGKLDIRQVTHHLLFCMRG